jgi:hypothetical protein
MREASAGVMGVDLAPELLAAPVFLSLEAGILKVEWSD